MMFTRPLVHARTALVALLLGVAAPAVSALAETGVTTANALNVRSGPGTHYAVVDTLGYGREVEVIDQRGSWLRIETGRTVGWVSSSYIAFGVTHSRRVDRPEVYDPPVRRPRPSRPDVGYDPEYQGPDYDIVDSRRGQGNVFSGPGRDYDLLAVLENGVQVRVLERGPEWTLITKDTIGRGYIRSSALSD